MCKDTDSALSTASKVCPPVQDGRGVPARTRDVGEELAGMTKRKLGGGGGEGEGLCCNGLAARPRVETNSIQRVQVCGPDVVAATCGMAGELCKGEATKEVEPDSPQNSCSVADGILMRQTKKHRIMRRRVSFCTQSSMRLVCRDLMLAQYFIGGPDNGPADDVGDQNDGDDDDDDEEEEEEEEEEGVGRGETDEGDGEGGTGEGRVAVAPVGVQNHDRKQGPGTDGGVKSPEAAEAMEEDGNDARACGAQGAAWQQERGGDVEVQAKGGVDDDGEDGDGDGEQDDDSKVMTKTNDGPSLTNVMSQALIMGLVERQVRDVGDVLRTLRQCVVPDCFGPPADDDDDELTESELAASSDEDGGASDDSSSEMRRRCMRRRCRRGPIDPKMILDSSVFDDAHTHIQVLLDRINNNGRASLLPSTVQIGPPFIPALEFLLLSTKEAQSLNEQDRARVARMSRAL